MGLSQLPSGKIFSYVSRIEAEEPVSLHLLDVNVFMNHDRCGRIPGGEEDERIEDDAFDAESSEDPDTFDSYGKDRFCFHRKLLLGDESPV
jgi:hypothetical protein